MRFSDQTVEQKYFTCLLSSKHWITIVMTRKSKLCLDRKYGGRTNVMKTKCHAFVTAKYFFRLLSGDASSSASFSISKCISFGFPVPLRNVGVKDMNLLPQLLCKQRPQNVKIASQP